MNPSTQHEDLRFLELLRRWLEGDFNRSDEQELQELTRTDAFRREAMDGFVELPEQDHGLQLAALKARIRERTGYKKRFAYMPQMLAAAAGIVLIISAILFYPKAEKVGNEGIAKVEPSESPAVAPPSTQDQTDAAPGAPARDLEKSTAAGKTGVSGTYSRADEIKERQKQGPAAPKQDDLAISEAEASQKNIATEQAQPSAEKTAYPQSKEAYKVSGAPTSQQNIPTSPANTYPNASSSKTQEFSKAKKSRATPDSSQMDIQPQPQGGWDAFQNYIRQNARLTDQARNNNITGTVRLEFIAGVDGKPLNIKVLRGPGYGCNEEAIRLVETWKWTPGAKPVTVDIAFVR